jgi:hypothetical protein
MDRSKLIYDRLMLCIHSGEVKNSELILMVKNISDILGLKNITTYAEDEKISYPAAIKRKTERLKIDRTEFIIDNF